MENQPDKAAVLNDVSREQTFKLHKTEIEIHNLHELADALEIMSDESYSHHVGAEGNDFADWVQGVVKDLELSEALNKSKNRREALQIVDKRLIHLQGKDKIKALTKKPMKAFSVIEFAAGLLFGIMIGILIAKYLLF